MNPLYPVVAERGEHCCEYCHAPEEVFNFAFEVEHCYPRSEGGLSSFDNLSLSCQACNRFKSDFVTGFDPETQLETALFHPRRDVWGVHFYADAESGELVGLTQTGRATVTRLQMNRPQSRRARLLWMHWLLYP